MPSVLARKGMAARDRVADAFRHYFRTKGHEEGSNWIKNRWATSLEHGLSVNDIARFEVGGGLAVMVNTVPATFWLTYFIFSNPDLLEEIRKD